MGRLRRPLPSRLLALAIHRTYTSHKSYKVRSPAPAGSRFHCPVLHSKLKRIDRSAIRIVEMDFTNPPPCGRFGKPDGLVECGIPKRTRQKRGTHQKPVSVLLGFDFKYELFQLWNIECFHTVQRLSISRANWLSQRENRRIHDIPRRNTANFEQVLSRNAQIRTRKSTQ